MGIIHGPEFLAEVSFAASLKHGERLFPAINTAMSLAGVEKGTVDLIAVATGPGSFTGLRIGVASAKGLAAALEVPVVGVSTLDLYRESAAFWRGPAWLILPDRRDWLIVQLIERGTSSSDARSVRFDDWQSEIKERPQEPTLFIGPAVERYRSSLEKLKNGVVAPQVLNRPSGLAIARSGLKRFKLNPHDELAELEPYYLQPLVTGSANQSTTTKIIELAQS